jgi:hypothetical protein
VGSNPTLSASLPKKCNKFKLYRWNKAFCKRPVVHKGGPQWYLRMLTPWKNPRSENLWFRRRVPASLVSFMGRREIKFSLGTSDPKLAQIRCLEENVKIERMWHEHLHGKTYAKLTQRQIDALAGEFYREMVAAYRDNPGKSSDWDAAMNLDAKRKQRLTTLQPRAVHYRYRFGNEVDEFLKGRNLALSGETFDAFVLAYLEAKAGRKASQEECRPRLPAGPGRGPFSGTGGIDERRKGARARHVRPLRHRGRPQSQDL